MISKRSWERILDGAVVTAITSFVKTGSEVSWKRTQIYGSWSWGQPLVSLAFSERTPELSEAVAAMFGGESGAVAVEQTALVLAPAPLHDGPLPACPCLPPALSPEHSAFPVSVMASLIMGQQVFK